LADCIDFAVRSLACERDDRTDCACSRIHLRNGRSVARQLAIIATPGSMVDHTEILVAFPVYNISGGEKMDVNRHVQKKSSICVGISKAHC
jgi:hypothetical protein